MASVYITYMCGHTEKAYFEGSVKAATRKAEYAPNSVSDRTIEQYGWAESIMYRVFYPLLGRIDNSYLIIYNEFMRNKNRSSLEYNCVAKYSTQTEHRLVFEYFPIIDEIEDFMILADLDSGQAYKGRISTNRLLTDCSPILMRFSRNMFTLRYSPVTVI